MARYDYWTHGVSMAVEDMNPVTLLQRTGRGTVVRQTAGSGNWFHFAVPTPTVVDDEEEIHVVVVAFHAETRNNAIIREVNAWMGGTFLGGDPVGGSTPHVYHPWKMNFRLTGPVVVCLWVDFLQADSEVTFQGAGAGFED